MENFTKDQLISLFSRARISQYLDFDAATIITKYHTNIKPITPTRSGSLNENRSKRVNITCLPCQTGFLAADPQTPGFVHIYV